MDSNGRARGIDWWKDENGLTPEQKADIRQRYQYTPDIRGYKDAVWDFLLEHSEVLDTGTLFFKFHAKDRDNLENRILSRWRYNYHREDVGEKQATVDRLKEENQRKRAERQERYEAYRAESRKRKKAQIRKQKVEQLLATIKSIYERVRNKIRGPKGPTEAN